MHDDTPLVRRLRNQIVSDLHVGHLRPGDRLPSIRRVASATHEDPRAVAQAYRILEAECLVEVRHRSGIFAAPQSRAGSSLVQTTTHWAARVMADGLRRGIGVQELGQFFLARTTRRRVRCVFVESSHDVIAAFTWDLREQFGMDARVLRPGELLGPMGDDPRRVARGTPETHDVDLLLTTPFHSADVGPAAGVLGIPLIVATVNTRMVAAIERQLRAGSLTVICVDPGFGDRLRMQYAKWITPDTRMRVLHPGDARSIAALDPAQPVLLTRAAHRLLGAVDLQLLYPHSPTISADSAHDLIEFVIGHNLIGLAAEDDGPSPSTRAGRERG